MVTVHLVRSKTGPDFTAGVMTCPSLDEHLADLILATVEDAWRGNQPLVSCIPEGTYPLQFAWSGKRNRLVPFVLDVPHRSLIEIHVANTDRDVEGCIGVGLRATDTGVALSVPAVERFEAWLGLACRDHVQLAVENPPDPRVVTA